MPYSSPTTDRLDDVRQLVTLRGTIAGHGGYTYGWWIFKTHVPILFIHLNEHERDIINRRLRHIMSSDDDLPPIPRYIEYIIHRKRPNKEEFPIGSVVEVTLRYEDKSQRFTSGAAPYQTMRIRIVERKD